MKPLENLRVIRPFETEEPTTDAQAEENRQKGKKVTLHQDVRLIAGGAHLVWDGLDEGQRKTASRFYAASVAWNSGDVKAQDLSKPYVDEGSKRHEEGRVKHSHARQDYRDAVKVLDDRQKAVVFMLIAKELSFRDMARRWPQFGDKEETARKAISRVFYTGLNRLRRVWGY